MIYSLEEFKVWLDLSSLQCKGFCDFTWLEYADICSKTAKENLREVMPSDSLEGKDNQLTCITKFMVSFHVSGFSKLGVYKSQEWSQQEAWKKDSKAQAQRF